MMSDPQFTAPISREIWDLKYRLKSLQGEPVDRTLDDTFWRVARAGAAAEKGGRKRREKWAQRFHDAFADFGFLPAGRILAGAGTGRTVTLFNCFVMGEIRDDLGAIFEGVKEAALTMQQGGGIGHDFSTLRPQGALVRSIGADASGPVSFMDVWDAMCRTIMSAGSRRGAMMATLRCDHPDIELFVAAKSDAQRLRNFNLSVLVTDAFLAAVRADSPWELKFGGQVYRTVKARELWERIMRSTYDFAEPGVVFIDRINERNNLAYCEEIHATNPCGEQPLPPYGACLLGSINLAHLIEHPFAPGSGLDVARLEERVALAVRFLDNAIDLSNYPLKPQRKEALAKRRIGLGITGLADALIFCGKTYGTEEAAALAGTWMAAIQNAAYRASAELAAEKGAFPLYSEKRFLKSPNVALLDKEVRALIRRHGIRNGCLTSIAPTGTISLLAGNVSSGIEPVYDFVYRRRVTGAGGAIREEQVEDYAHARFRREFGPTVPLPASFVRAGDLSPRQHLRMQAALQPYVDSAISKTINCPEAIPFAEFKDVYLEAHALSLKGCTTYRPNPVTGAVLQPVDEPRGAVPAAPSVDLASASPEAETAREPATPPHVVAQAVPQAQAALPQAALQASAERPSEPIAPRSSERSADHSSDRADVVYMSRPLEREGVLSGYTYKLKWPGSDHAIYVTINDIEQTGAASSAPRRRPFEIFINTRNLEHYAWTVALTRMISAVFRRGGDVTFVAEELKAVFDPQGGHWVAGRYVPSLLAAIGEVIERHMIRIGFLQGEERLELTERREEAMAAFAGTPEPAATERQARPKLCPRCSSADYVQSEGCWICQRCGFSRCG
jgi:ribonucleoside-diphosphate reductase alpha chain